MSLRLHLREEIVRQAYIDLLETYSAWGLRHDLTAIEEQQMLVELLARSLKYALRIERHGTDQEPAGLERNKP